MQDNFFYDAETPTQAVFQALGAASVCWEHIEDAGIFESTRAKKIGEDLIEALQYMFDSGLGWEE